MIIYILYISAAFFHGLFILRMKRSLDSFNGHAGYAATVLGRGHVDVPAVDELR